MPVLGAETSAVQTPMVRYSDDIVWTSVKKTEALRRRGDEIGLVSTLPLSFV